MSRSVLSAVAVGALMFVLQHSVLAETTVFGVHPELLLLFSVACGLAGGSTWGVAAGFAAGLCSDAFMTSPMGLGAFAFGLAGYVAGILSDDTTSLPAATVTAAAVSSATGLVTMIVVGRLTGSMNISFTHAVAVVFVASLLNGVFALPVRRMLRNIKINERDLAW